MSRFGRRRASLASAALLGAGALALAGCGVPVDRGPTSLSQADVPFGLLNPSPPSTTTTTANGTPVTVSVQIFLLSSTGHVMAVDRDVPVPAPLSAILSALVDGPTNAETAGGLSSAVPGQTQVVSATMAGGVAVVDLAGTFGQLVGQAQIDAVAQIVFTATVLPGVTGVSFELGGQQVAVPTDSGAEVLVVGRAQYATLAPS